MTPDLAPIGHVWDEMDRRLEHHHNPSRTLPKLGEALREVLQDIPQAFLVTFMASMRWGYVPCVNASGGHTHYWWCEHCFELSCLTMALTPTSVLRYLPNLLCTRPLRSLLLCQNILIGKMVANLRHYISVWSIVYALHASNERWSP